MESTPIAFPEAPFPVDIVSATTGLRIVEGTVLAHDQNPAAGYRGLFENVAGVVVRVKGSSAPKHVPQALPLTA